MNMNEPDSLGRKVGKVILLLFAIGMAALIAILIASLFTRSARAEMHTKKVLDQEELVAVFTQAIITEECPDLRPYTWESASNTFQSLFENDELDKAWFTAINERVRDLSSTSISLAVQEGLTGKKSVRIIAVRGDRKWAMAFSATGFVVCDTPIKKLNRIWEEKNLPPKPPPLPLK